jgi:cell division protease FtsH
MSDDPTPRNDGPNRRNQEPQFNWKGFLLLSVVVLLVGSALVVGKEATRAQNITYKDFKKLVEDNLIDRDMDLVLIQKDTTNAEIIEGYALRSKLTEQVGLKPARQKEQRKVQRAGFHPISKGGAAGFADETQSRPRAKIR